MIHLNHLSKTYHIPRKAPGLFASVKGLFHRDYELVKAVKELSFTIEAGERVGFLGPNGAGKTTTLKMLSGLLWPTSGEVSVLGFEPRYREAAFLKEITLVMGQKQQLLWDLPPIETFELNRIVYRIDRPTFQRTLDELIELLNLGELLTKPSRQLSLGERMKCEFTAALIHQPRILFLDEPTIGLDITMQAQVRQFIRTYNEQTGATILLTSHYMDDVLALCPRVIIIDRGQLRYDGSLDALVRQTMPEKRITIHLENGISQSSLSHLGTIRTCTPLSVVLDVPLNDLNAVVSEILATIHVVDLKVEDPPLEDVMSQLFTQGAQKQ